MSNISHVSHGSGSIGSNGSQVLEIKSKDSNIVEVGYIGDSGNEIDSNRLGVHTLQSSLSQKENLKLVNDTSSNTLLDTVEIKWLKIGCFVLV